MGEWWHNWWDWWEKLKINHPKTTCSLQYVCLFLFVFLAGHVLSGWANHVYFRYPFNDTSRHPISITANLTIDGATETYVAEMYADNARSILCTLVGCEAAIVAIVVSLTLIAIELTASEYSPRVIDISLRNLDMWILLLIYGISIFLGIILIKQLPYDSRILYDDVSFAFWLGVFSYAALFPYLRNIIWLLKPKNIIKRLASEITCEKIKKEDKFQPIVDITLRSILKHDFETTRVALDAVTYQAIQAINSDCEEEISKRFCDHLKGLGKLAASVADDESAKEVITSLKEFTIETMKENYLFSVEAKLEAELKNGSISEELRKEFKNNRETLPDDNATVKKEEQEEWVITVYNEKKFIIRKEDRKLNIYKKNIKTATTEAIESLKDVGKAAADKGLKAATSRAISSLEVVGTTAAENELKDATKDVASALGEVGTTAAVKGKELEDATKDAAKSLGAVGEAAATDKEKELEDVVKIVASSLKDVGKIAAEKGEKLKKATMQVVTSLKVVGTTAANAGLATAVGDVILSIEDVGTTAVETGEELELTIEQALQSLEDIGKAALDKGEELQQEIEDVAESLCAIGKVAARKQLNKAIEQAAISLLVVGKIAVKRTELENSTKEVAKSLAELTINAKKIEDTISKHGGNITNESDKRAFSLFYEIYKQELDTTNENTHE